MKRDFKVKKNTTFFINFKEALVAKNCLRHDSGPLIESNLSPLTNLNDAILAFTRIFEKIQLNVTIER